MEKEQIAALVQRAQAGDQQAMESLLQLAHTSVSYQCRKIMAHPQDAEDMTQEVLIKIYNSIGALKEPEKFLSWANSIAARQCINERRRNPKDLQFAEDEEGHSVLDQMEELDKQKIPDAAIDNAETTHMIAELVDALPDAQRVCTYLFYYDQLSVKEIAELVGVSENTIKSRLNYARKAIKDGVQDYEKKGVKLYGLSPLPFLLYFLRGAAESGADPQTAALMAKAAAATGGAAGIAAGGAGAAGTAGAAAGTGTAAGSAAAGAAGGLAVKITAGVLAGVLAVGGVGLALSGQKEEPEPEPATPSAAETVEPVETVEIVEPVEPTAVGIASYTMVRTTVETYGSAEIYLEAPQFEEISEGYRKLNETFDNLRAQFLNGEDHNVAYLLAHLDNPPGDGPLCYIETYEVENQDENSVTIKISYQYDFGYFKDKGSGYASRTFETRTGEQTDPPVTEEITAGMLEWIEEQKEEYATGWYEYGENFFVFCRPEFYTFGGGHGPPRR
ncbi:MAG: RNA polymerase sigma factor [Oscillospiraceae bacterium]